MSTDLQPLVRDFYLARLALLIRHEEVAKQVSDYDVNNAYQYIINREETHVSWLQHALLDLLGTIPADPPAAPWPRQERPMPGSPWRRRTRAPTGSSSRAGARRWRP